MKMQMEDMKTKMRAQEDLDQAEGLSLPSDAQGVSSQYDAQVV